MTDKVLGIDIGEDAVKAVLVNRSFKGGYRIVAARTVSVAQAGGIATAVKTLMDETGFQGCPAAMALSTDDLSFRNVTLPFQDDKKIRQILPFEVEPLLHFPVEEAVLDYVFVRRGAPSDLFVSIARKAHIQERTAHLSAYVKKIIKLDAEGSAVAGLVAAKSQARGCFLLLDVGAEHTTGVLFQDGRLCQIRSFAFGGNHITRAIAEALGVDAGEAELRKRENRDGTSEAALQAIVHPFLDELNNTISFLKLQGHLQEEPQRIYLTGGGALFAPFRESLSRHFTAPVEAFDLLKDAGIHCDEAFRPHWNAPLMNQALALAVAGHKKSIGFNFRMEESKVRAAFGRMRGALRWAAVAAAFFIMLAGVDTYLDYRYNRQRLDALKSEITTLFKTYQPQATRIIDPVSQMKGGIMEARKVSLGIVESQAGMTALSLLKDISSLAPPAAELHLGSFVFEKDMILLKGQVKNFDAVDALKKEFMKSKFFETVAIGSTAMAKQGEKVEFEMRVTLKK
jgi:general secretion pathway protein L